MTELLGKASAVATTTAMVSALKLKVPPQMSRLLIHVKENNTNAIKYQVLASNDDVTYETLKAATTVAKNGSTYETLSDPWLWVDVQVQDNVAETHGVATVVVSGV